MDAGIVGWSRIEHGGEFGKRHAGLGNRDHGCKRACRDCLRGRNDDCPRFATRQRSRCLGTHGNGKIGRALRPLRMHQAVDSDCPIPIKPARKGLCDVPGQHRFA
jgi:hypothetical protein